MPTRGGDDSSSCSETSSRQVESTFSGTYDESMRSTSNDASATTDAWSSQITTPAGHVSKLYSSDGADFTSQSGSSSMQPSESCSFDVPTRQRSKTFSSKLQQQLAPPNLEKERRTNLSAAASPSARSIRSSGSKADTILDSLEKVPRVVPRASPSRRPRNTGAAKLMLVGPQRSALEESSSMISQQQTPMLVQGPSIDSTDLKDLQEQVQRSKQEFTVGTTDNRRYNAPSASRTGADPPVDGNNEDDNATPSEAPSFLNKSEIFHATAAAAVVALLRPSNNHDPPILASKSGDTRKPAATSPTSQSSPANNSSAGYDSPLKHDVSQSLLSQQAERKLEALQAKMKEPTKTLTDLLTAIASEDQEQDLGHMVRRKNACGALHVLTSASANNRVHIGWTMGVLPALKSVLLDGLYDSNNSDTTLQTPAKSLRELYPDNRIRAEYIQARNRAIAALMNLSMPKENRMVVLHTPGLVTAAIAWIRQDFDETDDDGTARKGCCMLLAFLGKSPENRLLLAQVPGLMEALVHVLAPKIQQTPSEEETKPGRKVYPWSSGDSSSESEGEEKATKVKGSPGDKAKNNSYDGQADALLKAARQNAFALLYHLLKEKDNAYHIARDDAFVSTLVEISKCQESPSHTLALQMLASLTRHRLNTKILVFQKRNVVSALVAATSSSNLEARRYACFALQNIAQDKSCRQELAVAEGLLVSICHRARSASDEKERLAAVSTLKNLCDEPANLIPMTNAPDAVSTLMHLAHDRKDGVTEAMQYRACDALATLSHWLRKIATSGQNLNTKHNGSQPAPDNLCIPSLRVVTWNQWE